MNEKPTKTKETKIQYQKKMKVILKKYQRDTGFDSILDVDDFIGWFESLQSSFRHNTWRIYKAAIVFCLQVDGKKSESDRILAVSYDKKNGSKNLPEQTSSNKKKGVKDKEIVAIQKMLVKRKNAYWNIRALAFIKATLVTGLRPCEWENVFLITSKCHAEKFGLDVDSFPVLRVENAKITHGRSHGPYRHILLHGIPDEEARFLEYHLRMCRGENRKDASGEKISLSDYTELCGQALRRNINYVSEEMKISRGICIYSFRHQFMANLKRSGYKLVEIAALAGHATNETAKKHYGKRRTGKSGGFLPQALEEEVNRVRVVADNDNPFGNKESVSKNKRSSFKH